MSGWKIESLGLTGEMFDGDRDGAKFGQGIKWRLNDPAARPATPVEKTIEQVKEEHFNTVDKPDDRIEFSSPAITEGMLSSMDIEQLKAVAAQLGVSRVSKTSKEDLIKAILHKQG